MQLILMRLRATGPVIPLMVVLLFMVGLPMAVLVLTSFIDVSPRPGSDFGSFTWENYQLLGSAGTLEAAWNTLLISLGGTAMAVFIGGLIAWLAARTDVPCRWLAQLAGIVPLFMSALVGTLAWALIASPNAGYVNIALRSFGLDGGVNIYSIPGIIFVMGLFYAPYTFLFVNSALTLMNPELEEAASVHGATMRRVLSKITFPIVTPAVAGAAILSFALIAENFPVVQILGANGGISALPSRIFRLMVASPQRANEAAALGIALVVLLSGVIFVQRKLVSRRSYVTVSGKGFRPRRVSLGRWRWPAFAFVALYVVLAVILPYFALLQSALRQHQFLAGIGDFFDVSAFSLENFIEAMQYDPFQLGMRNSLIVAFATAILGGSLHFVLAYVVRRTELRGRSVLEYVANMPVAMPALVLGMGILWAYIRLPFPIYGTLAILVIAYATRYLPQGFQGISTTIVQVDQDLEDAAVVAGASRVRSVRSITMPLIKTGVVSTMLLLFILSFRELSTTLFLFTADTRTLAIVIYGQWGSGQWPLVASMSLMESAVLLAVTLVGRKWFGLRGGD